MSAKQFESMYQSNWTAVLNYVRLRLGEAPAHDLSADAFATAWARRSAFDPERGTPEAWLWAIVRSRIADRRRKNRVRARSYGGDAGTSEQRNVGSDREPELQGILDAIGLLSPVDQEIIALRFGAETSNQAIAAQLGLTDGNVRVRLHRALARVRQMLADETGGDHE